MRTCPYDSYEASAFWGQTDELLSECAWVDSTEKITSYGSCFASKISRHLRQRGYNYIVTELPGKESEENIFSSRSGNIYSLAHLLSKLESAIEKKPIPKPVLNADGSWSNPLRPFAAKYRSAADALNDERVHNEKFIESFARCDTLILTVGLNEYWFNAEEEYAYGTAPGCGWGAFNEERDKRIIGRFDQLKNLAGAVESIIYNINRKLKLIYTVSPVPLAATFTRDNVIKANFISKSMLCASIREHIEDRQLSGESTKYFPAFEIINNPHTITRNFERDMRTISMEGEARVMSAFFGTNHETTGKVSAVNDLDLCDEEQYFKNYRLNISNE